MCTARGKCTPSAACGGVSPRESVSHDSQSPTAPYESCSLATPEGEILAALYFELLMRVKVERQVKFPPPGERWCAAPKGVHFHAPQARLFGFAAKRLINSIAAEGGDTTTLSHAVAVKLKNPKNLRPGGPSTLTPKGRVQWRYHNPQPRSGCRPLSEANTTLLYNLRRSRDPFLFIFAAEPPPPPFEPSEPSRPKGVSRRPHIPTVSSSGSWQKSFMAPSAIFPPSWAEPSTT